MCYVDSRQTLWECERVQGGVSVLDSCNDLSGKYYRGLMVEVDARATAKYIVAW
jgi:hypothetical protein